MAEYNESQINSNETERIAQETERINNEARRNTNETEREAREATRQSNESTRISEYNTFMADVHNNEDERIANEEERVQAEASRVIAENSRVEAENIRVGFYEGFNSELEGLHAKDEELSEQLGHIKNLQANIKDFGAVGDGINDDAPAIRKAIAFLKENNGGTLYIPTGIYYLNSGDPRGLNGQGIFSNGDFYTCFELIDNLTVKGEGSTSVLKYNSNRLGHNLSTKKGDVGAIFANYRVTQDSINKGYHVNGTIKFQDFSVEYTDLIDGEKDNRDYIDGQLIRIYSKDWTQDVCGDFVMENLTINNCPGHQIFSIVGAKSFSSRNVRIRQMGKCVNQANTDMSAFFVNATVCNITNCAVVNSERSSGTAYEIHSSEVLFSDNYACNVGTFINVVGNISGYDSTFKISHNIARYVRNFVVYWVYATRKLRHIDISNNDVLINYYNTTDAEAFIKPANDDGGFTADIQPVELLTVNNNVFRGHIVDDIAVDERTCGNDNVYIQNVKKFHFINNLVDTTRRSCIKLIDVMRSDLIEVDISNNTFRNLCLNTSNDKSESYRHAILFNPIPYYLENNQPKCFKISNNIIDMSRLSNSHAGIFLNTRHGGQDTNTKIFIEDNKINSNAREIYIIALNNTDSGTFHNGIYIRHNYSSPITNPASALTCENADLLNYVSGSSVSGVYNGNLITITKVNDSNSYWRTEGYAQSIPESGYFTKGSFLKHPMPSFTESSPYGWLCIASGTPGTWQAINLI